MMKVNSNNIIEVCQLPKDVVLGASVMSVTGNEDLSLENFKNILEYQEDSLLIQCKKYQVKISGKRLRVELYTRDEIKIKGKIKEIKFM